MNSRIKIIFFDMNGVVVYKERTIERFNKLVREIFHIPEFDTLSPEYGFLDDLYFKLDTKKIDDETFWRKFSEKVGVSLPPDWRKIFLSTSHTMRLRPQMKKLILYLKKQNIKTAVFSNINPTYAKRHYRLGHYALFDEVFLSHEIGLRKPDPRFYEYILNKVKVLAEEAIFIDDAAINIKAAKKIGMNGILFISMDQCLYELAKFIKLK